MSNYIMTIDELVKLFDNAEENSINMNLILDANIAYDLTKELEFLGKEFFVEIKDQHEIELEEANSGILSVALSIYDDGTKMYFLEPALYDGVVIKDDGEFTDVICIQDEVLDVIEPDKNFSNVVIAVLSLSDEIDESCDCNFCQECECICDEEEYEDLDREFIAEFIDEEIAEVLTKLEEGVCHHCAIGEALENTFKLGYEQALIDIRKDINIHLGE